MNGESHVSTHWTERLSAYHDGELSPAEQAACESHLAECDECRIVLRDIQRVIAWARADIAREPASDLWRGVLDRMAPTGLRPGLSSAFAQRRISFTLPQLALAASLLVAVSAGVAYVAAGRGAIRPTPLESPIQAVAEPVMLSSADFTPANFADAQFDQAVADLERILVAQRDVLDPRTIVIIERNLSVIDEAIRQARAALDGDPANPFLNSHLADARRRKLDLLRRATNIGSSSGD